MLNINKKLTPYNYSVIPNKQNKYIVIHYVGAESSAKNNAIYYSKNKLQASAHYFVDSESIWQSVNDWDKAWHCGGSLESNHHPLHNICTNSNSIGIEMCCFKDPTGRWFFTAKTVQNTVDLVKILMKKYKIPYNNVVRHYDVTGKLCPKPYIDENIWKEFKSKLLEVNELISINDIVWELSERKIITDKELWLNKLETDTNSYWLARKLINYIKERTL